MQRPTTTRAILLLLNVITFGSLLSYFAYDATLKYREATQPTAPAGHVALENLMTLSSTFPDHSVQPR